MSRLDRLARRLSRRTSSGRYIAEIDGLRFMAIALVVLFHAQMRLSEGFGGEIGVSPAPHNVIDSAVLQGRFGVHLFFIISGFILGLPFAAHHLAAARKISLKAFYLRRVTRLEPPYIIALTLFFLLASTTDLWGLWTEYRETLVPRYGAGLLYAHAFLFDGGNNAILPPAWSLEVEVQFYLLAPALALVFTIARKAVRRAVMMTLAVLAVIAQWMILGSVGSLPPTLFSYLQFFLMGFLLADVFLVDWRERPSQRWTWDAIGLLAWTAVAIGPPLVFGQQVLWVYRLVALPALFALAFCATFRGPILRALLSYRWIAVIGGMCYSIYLLHTPLMAILVPHTRTLGGTGYGTANTLVQFVVLGAVVLVAGAVFFAFVERPCMDPHWPTKLVARIRSSRPAGVRATEASTPAIDGAPRPSESTHPGLATLDS